MSFDTSKLNNIPSKSFVVVQRDTDNEDHIIKKRPDTGIRIAADKFVNSVVHYVPKGLKGSRNSNFYEFLSMGAIPNLVGSAMLITISNGLNNLYGGKDSFFAGMNGKKLGAGVILYAAGKYLGNKIINKGVHATTGVDLDMTYKKVVHELPDGDNEPGSTSVEFHKVFESATFPRWDLINKMGEEHGNRYEYYDKLAAKMGHKEPLNAPDQVVQPKVKEIIVKASAARSISSYVWAALGCAIASQDATGTFMGFQNKPKFTRALKELPKEVWRVCKESTKSLSKTKVGKALMIGAAASSILGIANAVSGFKAEKQPKTSSVDYTKTYQEF